MECNAIMSHDRIVCYKGQTRKVNVSYSLCKQPAATLLYSTGMGKLWLHTAR